MPRVSVPSKPNSETVPVEPLTVAEPIVASSARPAAEPLSAFSAGLINQARANEIGAEELFDRLSRGQDLTADERLFLRSVAPPEALRFSTSFERWLINQAARIRATRDLQAVAGSVADREQAAAQLEQARRERDDRAPELEAEIARLQAQLNELDNAVATAERDVDRRAAAVEALQQDGRLPVRVKEMIGEIHRRYRAEKQGVLQAETRLKAIDHLLAFDANNAADLVQIRDYVAGQKSPDDRQLNEIVFPQEPYRPGSSGKPRFQTNEWAKHCDGLRLEAEQHRATIARLEPVMQQVAEEVQNLKRFWVPK